MWVRNLSRFPQVFRKGEKIVVLKPQSVADVDLPKDANLKKLELGELNLAREIVLGQPAPIEKIKTSNKKGGKKKKGCRNEDR